MAAKEVEVKFDAKYPDKVNPQKVYPDKLMGPHKEIYVTESLVQTWRMYPCSMCGERTGWRDLSENVSVCVCSEECMKALAQQMVESLDEREREQQNEEPHGEP